jgi:tetratricopeptide (TPR) repeat protein
MRLKAILCSVIIPFLLCANDDYLPSESQNPQKERGCELFGEVITSGYSDQDDLQVLLLGRDAKLLQRAAVIRGNFDFHMVLPGWYVLKVADSQGRILAAETRFLNGARGHVALLAVRRAPNVAGTVSLAALSHSVPRRARQAFEEAAKACAAGNVRKQIDRLNAAIAIDPNFAEAHVDLAGVYSQMSQPEEAVRHARIAFELNPNIPESGTNLAALLIQLKRYTEAEAVARAALLNDDQDASCARLLLALVLIEQRRSIDQALAYLEQAVTEFPSARLFAAHAFVDIGRLDLAVVQVKEVLRSQAEHQCERAALNDWIAATEGNPRQQMQSRDSHSSQ